METYGVEHIRQLEDQIGTQHSEDEPGWAEVHQRDLERREEVQTERGNLQEVDLTEQSIHQGAVPTGWNSHREADQKERYILQREDLKGSSILDENQVCRCGHQTVDQMDSNMSSTAGHLGLKTRQRAVLTDLDNPQKAAVQMAGDGADSALDK